ncbi:serine/threonine phosphatase [Fragilaria crotonensis]|nr:serine/threonine phosphatase [Fragilaria crotonensis]
MLLLILSIHVAACLARECPSYGCLMLPRDIVFDEQTRKALARIRNNLDEKSLETLKTSGNAAHATLTLIGYKGGNDEDQINQDRAFAVNPFMESIISPVSTMVMGLGK